MQTLTPKPWIHKKHPGVPLCMASPQHRVRPRCRYAGVSVLMHEVQEKKDPRPSEQLSIGSGLAGWCQICARRMVGGKKGEGNFPRMRRNLVFFFCFFFFVNGGFSFFLACITPCSRPTRLSNGYLGTYIGLIGSVFAMICISLVLLSLSRAMVASCTYNKWYRDLIPYGLKAMSMLSATLRASTNLNRWINKKNK